MSCFAGPETSADGLVFAYDMGNTSRSWIGAPTTNLLNDPTRFDNTTYWTNFGSNSLIAPTALLYAPDRTYTAYAFSAKNINGYHTVYQNYNFTAGVTYTQSVYAKAGTLNTLYLQYASGPFSSWIGCTYNLSTGTLDNSTNGNITNVGDGWYRCSLTATAANTASGPAVYMYPSSAQYSGSNTLTPPEIYVWRGQLEVGSFMTPFVEGTRSNTQSIIDLTGRNTVTATNLSYAANNTFSFNGTSNYLTIPFNSNTFSFNNEQTINIWMKNSSPSSIRRNPYNQAYAGGGTITHENDTGFNYYYGTGGGNNTPYSSLYSSFNVVVGETAMITLTRNTSVVSWYKNGTFSNSTNNAYGAVVTGTSDILIGSGYTNPFAGNIYVVQLYNRALSAQEVKQSFYALRGRFGI